MNTIIDRFLLILQEEQRLMPWLELQTGIPRKRWTNIKQRGVMRTEELEAIYKLYPEYEVWLATGKEYPQQGQISPMTKRAHASLKTGPQAG
jgi:hypothetical protein